MFQYKRFSIGLSVLVLTTAGVAGCTAKGSQQPVGGTTPFANQTENRATAPQNSVANGISTNATGVQNTTANTTQSSNTTTHQVGLPQPHQRLLLRWKLMHIPEVCFLD
ncbi:hypothetical protein D2Q93_05205 [Alicyclobacillaceae bacterium I2511]|nr:hypothetical protein D2Q93_05205 [Alicyclobacillaceae bacterium I2511]